ncbi:MAG TPA: ATP-binding protein [Firmicutes bacterium]|nr:ATP-binding protein [Bacillota bacterium]
MAEEKDIPESAQDIGYDEFKSRVKAAKAVARPKPAVGSTVRHVIGVISGKGGVGKTFTASYLAVLLRRKGYRVAILDADVTGASIPTAFGLNDVKVWSDGANIYPAVSLQGIQLVSANLLLEHPGDPIIWRGPMESSLLMQFWTEVVFDCDVMIVDCPPGTSDIQLTVLQQLPMDGLILAVTPQSLVSVIASKAASMANMMDIPIIGAVMNMEYVTCPDCHRRIYPFGEVDLDRLRAMQIPVISEVPIDPQISEATDRGAIEKLEVNYLDNLADGVVKYLNLKDRNHEG